MSLELPPEVQAEIDEVSREHRTKFITDAWRVIHKLNALVEKRVDEGDFRGKDAAVALAVLIDKIRAIEPRLPEVEWKCERSSSTSQAASCTSTKAGRDSRAEDTNQPCLNRDFMKK